MQWVGAVLGLSSLWVLGRAPFVGLVVYPNLVVHRTWSVSRTYARGNIAAAEAVGYEGVLGGRGGHFPLVSMAELHLRDGRRLQVPGIAGTRAGVTRRLECMGLPPMP